MKSRKNIFLLFFIILLYSTVNAQFENPGAGISAGLGNIKGNSPAVSVFSGGIFIGAAPWFSEDMRIRLGFNYSRNIQYFIPENRTGKYYPFLKAVYLKAVISQDLNDLIFVEEGAGLLTVNDRTYSDTNVWDYGACFHAVAGLDFTNENTKGFQLSGGIDSGVTFNKTSASYFIFAVQLNYLF